MGEIELGGVGSIAGCPRVDTRPPSRPARCGISTEAVLPARAIAILEVCGAMMERRSVKGEMS